MEPKDLFECFWFYGFLTKLLKECGHPEYQ